MPPGGFSRRGDGLLRPDEFEPAFARETAGFVGRRCSSGLAEGWTGRASRVRRRVPSFGAGVAGVSRSGVLPLSQGGAEGRRFMFTAQGRRSARPKEIGSLHWGTGDRGMESAGPEGAV